MPSIVLDTDILCSGLIHPDSDMRKLLVLSAYGSVAQYLETVLEPEAQMMEEAARGGGRVGGSSERLYERNKARREALKRALPKDAPDDVCLVAGIRLFEDAMTCVRKRGRENVALWTGVEVAAARRLRDACHDVVAAPPQVPLPRRLLRSASSWTRLMVPRGSVDTTRPAVHAALEGDALLLTRSKVLVPALSEVVEVCHVDEFLADPPWNARFDLRRVDGRLLDDKAVWG